jgi:hypothetical protein
VRGHASAASGNTYGLYGKVDSPDGHAVYSDGPAKVFGPLEVTGRTRVKRLDATRSVVRSTTTPALDARSSEDRGAVLGGKTAPLRLLPRAGRPASGDAGDLFVDKQNRLWFCKGGTNWIRLA